jgi:clan AA aspartic protease
VPGIDTQMISGQVNVNGEAVIPLQVRSHVGQFEEIEFVVDTGFSSYLTLPPAHIASLQLPFFSTARYRLADGSQIVLAVHTAIVLWDGQDRDVYVLASSGGALIGMQMLRGHHLFVDVIDGGEVRIEARP